MQDYLNRKAHVVRIVFMTIVMIFSYLLFIRLIGDFGFHVVHAEYLNEVGLRQYLSENTYPLWHVFVAGLMKLGIPRNHSAALITSICNGATFLFVDQYLQKRVGEELTGPIISFLSATLMFVGPLFIPWYNDNLYLGQGSPNVWHNPTNLCVRPFAVISFVLLVEIVDRARKLKRDKKVMIMALGILMVSILAKPSWLQVYLPGVVLYLCYVLLSGQKNKRYIAKTLLPLAGVSLILIIIAAWKVFGSNTMDNGDGGVYIAPFLVMKIYAPNVFISLCLGYFFPAYVFIMLVIERILRKRPLSSDIAITWCLLAAGFGENIFLAERGREAHGNFGWGAQLMQFIVYVVAFAEYVRLYKDERNRIFGYLVDGGIVIYVIQFAVGLYWYYTCMYFW